MIELTRTAAGCVAGALLAGTALTAAPAQATTRPVRIVAIPCSGPALTNAVAASFGRTVLLRLAPSCTYNVATQLTLPANTRLTVVGGPSTTIRHDPAATGDRIFLVLPGASLRIREVFILDGHPTGDGGGILDIGELVLDHVTLSGNTTPLNGGAISIATSSSAVITDSVINANHADGNGGAISSSGLLTLVRTHVSANTAVNGAGVQTSSGTTGVFRSTFDHNVATTDGGGLANLSGGRTVLDHTLVQHNSAASGGGIANPAGTATTLRTSTVRLNNPDNCAPAGSVPGCTG